MPKISVIIPTYNAAQYIEKSLKSVLNQTYKDFEIIIVDDGSTDNTKEVLKPYLSSIIYIYQQNKKQAFARNIAIKKAQGDYIAFLDADDFWLPETLEIQKLSLDLYPEIAMVFGNIIEFDEKGNFEIGGIKKEELHIFEKSNNINFNNKKIEIFYGNVFKYLFKGNFVPIMTVMIRKTISEKIGNFDEQMVLAEDYDMWLRISKNYSLGYIKQNLANVRILSNSSSRKNIDFSYEQEIKALKKNIKTKINIPLQVIKKHISYKYFRQGYACFVFQKIKKARKLFAISLIYYPFQNRTFFYFILTLFPKLLRDKILQLNFCKRKAPNSLIEK
ncbi:MAG: glycosyltransferase [bacterium]